MSTVLALHSHLCSSNARPARVGNDAWDHNKVPNQIALQLSEHPRDFVAVELDLKERYLVSQVILLVVIVSPVHLLDCFLELKR